MKFVLVNTIVSMVTFLVGFYIGVLVTRSEYRRRVGYFRVREKKTLTIFGDGIHDDTKALQAYINGEAQLIHPDGTQFQGLQHVTRQKDSADAEKPCIHDYFEISGGACTKCGHVRR